MGGPSCLHGWMDATVFFFNLYWLAESRFTLIDGRDLENHDV